MARHHFRLGSIRRFPISESSKAPDSDLVLSGGLALLVNVRMDSGVGVSAAPAVELDGADARAQVLRPLADPATAEGAESA